MLGFEEGFFCIFLSYKKWGKIFSESQFFEILILKSFESRYYETDYADYAGVFFVGTATPRKYWRPENDDLAIRRMAVIGELDGISRVTRFINDFQISIIFMYIYNTVWIMYYYKF